jgi:hypothetical protein
MALLRNPLPEEAREDILACNTVVQYLRDMDRPLGFVQNLNSWDARFNPASGHWGLAAPLVHAQLADSALFTFLRLAARDPAGDCFYEIASDADADAFEEGRLTLANIHDDHRAWIGSGAAPGRAGYSLG